MAEFYLGQREQIAWVDETSYATLGGNSIASDGEVVGKNVTITPELTQGWQEVLQAGADSRDVSTLEPGPLQYRFTLSFSPVNWKWLMFTTFGTVQNAGSDPWTHTFTLKDTVTSFTLEWAKRGATAEVLTLTGCVIKRAVMRWTKGTGDRDGFMIVEAECVAQSLSKGTSVSTVAAGQASGVAFKFHDAKLTYASSEYVEVNSGEMVIESGIDEEDSRYANDTLSRQLGEPIPKTARYTMTLNVNQKDSTFTDDWVAAIAVSGTHTLSFIRGANDDIVFTMTNLFVDTANAPTALDSVDTQDLVIRPMTLAPVATDSITTYF